MWGRCSDQLRATGPGSTAPSLSPPLARQGAAVPVSGSQLSKAMEEPGTNPAAPHLGCAGANTARASVSSHPALRCPPFIPEADGDGRPSPNGPCAGPDLQVRGGRGRAAAPGNRQARSRPRFKMEKGTGQGAYRPHFPTLGMDTQPECGSASPSSTAAGQPRFGEVDTELQMVQRVTRHLRKTGEQ